MAGGGYEGGLTDGEDWEAGRRLGIKLERLMMAGLEKRLDR